MADSVSGEEKPDPEGKALSLPSETVGPGLTMETGIFTEMASGLGSGLTVEIWVSRELAAGLDKEEQGGPTP